MCALYLSVMSRFHCPDLVVMYVGAMDLCFSFVIVICCAPWSVYIPPLPVNRFDIEVSTHLSNIQCQTLLLLRL